MRVLKALGRDTKLGSGTLTALLIYLLAALVIFYPVPFRLGTVIAGFPSRDGWQYTWWLWFAKRLLLQGRGLSDLYLMNHPLGLRHPFQWTLIYLSLVALPLESVFSPATAFNLMVLSAYVLSGLSAYHLCRELTGRHWAAVVGGAIFAFAPNRLGHAMAGWLPQMTVYLYPWYALLLIRALRRPTLGRAIGLGVLAGLSATVYVMHIAYIMVPLTLIIVGAEWLARRGAFFQDRRGRYLALALALSLTIALPFLMPLIVGRFQSGLDYLATSGVVGHASDLLAYLTPSPYHPVLRALDLVPAFAQRVFVDREAMRAALAYPGLIAALLALWGILKGNPRPWRWLVLALGAALFALGPLLVVGGEPLSYTTDGYRTHVLLPYALLRQLPFLDWARTPGRLNVVGMLGLGVLAAYGAADVFSRFGSQKRAGVLGVGLTSVILFEFLPIWPFPVGDAAIPPVIQTIAEQPGDGAILHLPMDRRRVNHRALYFQTALERPIVGGEVLRALPATAPWWLSIEGLIDLAAPDILPRPVDAAVRRAWLRHFGVDWVVLHKLEPGDEARYRPPAEQLLGAAAVEDETLAAFLVPDEVPSSTEPYLYTLGRSGWHSPQQDGSVWRRWMYNDGEIYLYSTREESGALRFNVDSHLDFPLLEVYRDDHLLDTFVVDGRTAYTTRSFTLTKGMNVFRFHAPGGCPEMLDDARCWSDALLEPPVSDSPLPCDASTTCRTFVFDNLSFVPQREFDSGAGASVDFGAQMRLRGWELSATTLRPGDTLTVTLSWEARAELSEHYVVFLHLLSPDGELAAQRDLAPVGELIPADAWTPGSTFRYPVAIELPAGATGGEYRLLTGVYRWPSLERLPVTEPGADANAFELSNLEVAP